MASRRPAPGRESDGPATANPAKGNAKATKASSASTRGPRKTDGPAKTTAAPRTTPQQDAAAQPRSRSARLRLVHVDPLSVMKIAFLLSIALGIITIVAVLIIWGVLGAAGVWDSINQSVQQTVGSDSSQPFDITDYLGTGRVVGFTMLAAVIDVIVLTALATLGAFIYNLAATLLGGVEMTYAEDR